MLKIFFFEKYLSKMSRVFFKIFMRFAFLIFVIVFLIFSFSTSSHRNSISSNNQKIELNNEENFERTQIPLLLKKETVDNANFVKTITKKIPPAVVNLSKSLRKHYDPINWFSLLKRLMQTKALKRQFIPKKILLYDTFDWWKFNGKLESCPIPNLNNYCEFTENEDAITDAMIVVRDSFHDKYIDESDLPNSNTKVIYYSLESPYTIQFRITNGSFLASYWRGSDFWVPYYKWQNNNQGTTVKDIPITVPNYARGKTKLAAIVVSNCIPANDRMSYIRELQQFIPIDVYGWCGDLPCLRSSDFEKSCFPEISKTYKFYIAFENANCRDYITEKLFFNAFQLNMIPVVLGAHLKDYEELAPKNSFIHIEQFGSPEELAKYLKLLNQNDTIYNEYFKWRHSKIGRIVPTFFLCEVCAMLQAERYTNNSLITSRLENGFLWGFENEELCLKSSRWYWDRDRE